MHLNPECTRGPADIHPYNTHTHAWLITSHHCQAHDASMHGVSFHPPIFPCFGIGAHCTSTTTLPPTPPGPSSPHTLAPPLLTIPVWMPTGHHAPWPPPPSTAPSAPLWAPDCMDDSLPSVPPPHPNRLLTVSVWTPAGPRVPVTERRCALGQSRPAHHAGAPHSSGWPNGVLWVWVGGGGRVGGVCMGMGMGEGGVGMGMGMGMGMGGVGVAWGGGGR